MNQMSRVCYVEMTADNVCRDGVAQETIVSFACDANSAVGLRSSLEIKVSPPSDYQQNSAEVWVGKHMSAALAKFGISLSSDVNLETQRLVNIAVTDHSAIFDTERELCFPLCCEFVWDGEAVLDARLFSPDTRIKWHSDAEAIPSDMLLCDTRAQSLNRIMGLFGEEVAPPSGTATIPWEFPSLAPNTVKPATVIVEPAIQRNPHILHGDPSFPNSRVSVSSLLSSLMSGETVDDFIKMFPTVKRERAIAALAAIADENLTADEAVL